MSRKIMIAPSLLAADPMNFGQEALAAEEAGADIHHMDVMDGHFVPNLTFGIPFIKALKKISKIPLDVHIMISNPDAMALEYVKAGADYLVFHVEAGIHSHRLMQAIRDAGAKPGLAINPGTPLHSLEPLLEDAAMVNVMSVNPGFGGQKFIKATLKRIEQLRAMIDNNKYETLIQIDGGVNQETYRNVIEAGADVLVAGTAVYGQEDRKQAIAGLRG